MKKTDLSALKEVIETKSKKFCALSDDELEKVSGGDTDRFIFCDTDCGKPDKCYGCPFHQ